MIGKHAKCRVLNHRTDSQEKHQTKKIKMGKMGTKKSLNISGGPSLRVLVESVTDECKNKYVSDVLNNHV